jgi:hypothetical protein
LSHEFIADIKFFELLDAADAETTAAVRAAGCPRCGGRLDRADYPRKPRGGEVGVAGEIFDHRRSLCCARDGCRHRRTPPSLLFLGRRVYLAITVIAATWQATVSTAQKSPPRRTLRRWLLWFATKAPETTTVMTLRARMTPALEAGERLPGALIERLLPGRTIAAALAASLRLLSPLSTTIGLPV